MTRAELINAIRALVLDGKTYGHVAGALGVSRNVVAGICSRAQIKGPNADKAVGGHRARNETKTEVRVPKAPRFTGRAQFRPRPAPVVSLPEPEPIAVAVPEGRESFGERMAALEARLEGEGCVWIHGEPADGKRCGAPRGAERINDRPTVYCAHHHARVYIAGTAARIVNKGDPEPRRARMALMTGGVWS